MSMALCSTSYEPTYCCCEGLRGKNGKLHVPKAFVRIGGCCYKRGCLQASSHLMPGHLEGSFMEKKSLEKPKKKLEFVRTLLIDNYDSYTYNIYQELSTINGLPPVVIRNDELTWKDVCKYLYEEKAFDNIVISPGPGSPACPADIGICLRLLLECSDFPILGVCLGHQALGYVHGAEIIHAPEPVHGRLNDIEHNGCGLFNDIPSGRNSGFKVVRYHSLVIDAKSLPRELIPIAWTAFSDSPSSLDTMKFNSIPDVYQSQTTQKIPVDSIKNGKYQNLFQFNGIQSGKIVMGIMHSSRPHYGVQFHPESVATCYGSKIFQNFREITENYWQRSKLSFIKEQNGHYNACMQVRHASQLFREIPRTRQLTKDLNGFSEAPKSTEFTTNAIQMGLGIVETANFHRTSTTVKNVKLKWKKFDKLASQVGGSRNVFFELFGKNKAENTFWLDSSSIEKGRARFSFMGSKGGSLWKQVTFRLSDESNTDFKFGGHLSVEDAQGHTENTFLQDGFFDFLNKELLSIRYDEKDYEGLPFDFYGGYVGYIGYNLKVECGMRSNRHKSTTPDACFFFADNLLVIDHSTDDVYILSLREKRTLATPWLDETEQKLIHLKSSSPRKSKEQTSHATKSSLGKPIAFVPEKSREDYIKDVKHCLKYIKDGESYELCLTTQIRKSISDLDSLGLYLHLREKNPAPYAAWLNFSKGNLQICCSSPERFLRLDKNGILEAKPIKGTVPRGLTQEEDEQLKLRLQYSEKDQAENLMIVDLLRNDLGRVCESGSVHVPNLMDIESYATVHTMVSTIRGRKRSNISSVDCVRAAFPGGSMTGAPKLRSMEILDSIESCSRGIYSGSIGFFSYNQTFDLNIVIRTVVVHNDEASIGAGGAIVALSNPEDEFDEMVLKTCAPAKAVMDFD